MEDFRKLLECPVCYYTLTPPVQSCAYGHLICRGCKNQLQSCPTCRGDFSEFKNTLFDQLLESLPVSCAFAANGCEKLMNSREKVSHENVCNYRLIKCPRYKCQETEVIYCKLKTHLSNNCCFNAYLTFNKYCNVRINLKNPTAEQSCLIYNNDSYRQYFCWRCVIDLQKQIVIFCVQYLGRQEDASEYVYQISFTQGFGISFNFGGYCLPYMDKDEEILSHPKVLTLSIDKLFLDDVPPDLDVNFLVKFSR